MIKPHYTLDEACQFVGLGNESIVQFIEREWLKPFEAFGPQLDDEDLARIGLIRQLQDDFGVNAEGIDIILHLIDEIHRLRAEIRRV